MMNRLKNMIHYVEGKSSQLLMFYVMVVIEMLAMFLTAILQIAMKFKTDILFHCLEVLHICLLFFSLQILIPINYRFLKRWLLFQ